MRTLNKWMTWMGAIVVLAHVLGCEGSAATPTPDPRPGETSFVSAKGSIGQLGFVDDRDEFGSPEKNDESANQDERTVEEGDIYRVLGGNLILNLNSYRGLQLIDFSDVSQPEIVGRQPINGAPVEMYVVGNLAVVLLNNHRGYQGTRAKAQVDSYYGGLVVTIDIADPSAPRLLDQAPVPGWISTSRLVRGSGRQAVYLAANHYHYHEGGSTTLVRSFAVTAEGELITRSTIDLGGYVVDIQATPDTLLVARNDWTRDDNHGTVALIDISDPDGLMVEGAEVATEGIVRHKSNMNIYQRVLRVASSATWSGSSTNHLQTFEVSDIHRPLPVDHDRFGDGEQLFATLFLKNKAFFVTYRQVDPFHAFYIDDAGQAVEKSEYVISGWNDFFQPVLGGARLVGIGVDDQNGQTMAVSLYDITDLENPQPLVARASVDAEHSWSEARWDDRAFSILDNAVEASGPNGQTESGLVLLPFSGYDAHRQRYIAAVQIFTFSENSLTRRGVMEHGTWVRRSFVAQANTTANLSECELSLFDNRDPDSPAELGRVELAPNYTDFLIFGGYGARLKFSRDYYWWWGESADMPDNELQIVPLDAHPDAAEPIAVVSLPSAARVYQVGDLVVAVESRWVEADGGDNRLETRLQVYDLSDPSRPVQAGSLVTDRITNGYSHWFMRDCFDCGWYGYYSGPLAYPVGQGLAFLETVWESGSDSDGHRYWSRFEIEVVDLRDAEHPTLAETISLPAREEGMGALAQGDQLYVSHRIPVDVEGDPRAYAKYYFRKIDLGDPANPRVGAPVNVPGSLVAVQGDLIFTHDAVWGQNILESAINKLRVRGSVATLLARRRFADRQVNTMLLDGAGHALVSHRLSWWQINQDSELSWEDAVDTLAVLDAEGDDLTLLSEVEIANWAWLRDATAGRALYGVPGGLLVINLDDPRHPFAQAFFPVQGWPQRLQLNGDQIIFPAGRYGIYRFDLNTFNLGQPR